jgi:hypothetical protein
LKADPILPYIIFLILGFGLFFAQLHERSDFWVDIFQVGYIRQIQIDEEEKTNT